MARILTNKSRFLQGLKKPTNNNIGGLYYATIVLKPGESATVTDAEYFGMKIDTTHITVNFVPDSVPDSEEEVLLITEGGGGGGGDGEDCGLCDVFHVDEDTQYVGLGTDTALGVFTIEQKEEVDNYAVDHSALMVTMGDEGVMFTLAANEEGVALQSWENRPLRLNPAGNHISIESGLKIGSNDGPRTSLDVAGNMVLDGAIIDSDGYPSVNSSARGLLDEDGKFAVKWSNDSFSGSTANRPDTSSLAVGFTYFDTTLNAPVWWNGTEWVEISSDGGGGDPTPPELPYKVYTKTITLTPAQLGNMVWASSGILLVSLGDAPGHGAANPMLVWETMEFLCDLRGGDAVAYTMTNAHFYTNIDGNYPGGQKIPLGPTADNGSVGLLTRTGWLNRRIVFNSIQDMFINTSDSINLSINEMITGGNRDVKIRVTFRVIDALMP